MVTSITLSWWSVFKILGHSLNQVKKYVNSLLVCGNNKSLCIQIGMHSSNKLFFDVYEPSTLIKQSFMEKAHE